MTSPTAAPVEEIIYNANGVIITPSLIRFSNQTFPVSAINSVAFGQTKPKGRGGLAVPVTLIIGAGVLFGGPLIERGALWFGLLMVAVFFAFAAWLCIAEFRRVRPHHFTVVLMINGGDARPFETEDEATARELIAAVERVMSSPRQAFSAAAQTAPAMAFPPSHSEVN